MPISIYEEIERVIAIFPLSCERAFCAIVVFGTYFRPYLELELELFELPNLVWLALVGRPCFLDLAKPRPRRRPVMASLAGVCRRNLQHAAPIFRLGKVVLWTNAYFVVHLVLSS